MELPLRELFEAPTVAAASPRLVRAAPGRRPRQAPPIAPRCRATRGGLPLSFAQQRLWFLDQLEPGSPAYNIPLAVRLTGELSVRPAASGPSARWSRRHEALRTTFAAARTAGRSR